MSSTHVATPGAIAIHDLPAATGTRARAFRSYCGILDAGCGHPPVHLWDVLTASHDTAEGSPHCAKAATAEHLCGAVPMAAVGFAVGAFGLAWLSGQ
jgi:hypothetical protein